MSGPSPATPTGSFADHIERVPDMQPVGIEGSSFFVQLSALGSEIGWLGENSGQWCVVVNRSAAIAIEPYVWQEKKYYRNANATSRYMSVSDSKYVGFYGWSGASSWTLNGDILYSNWAQAQLSFYSSEDGYIYAKDTDGYTLLTVEFVAA